MNKAQRDARNAAIRQRRADGALLKNIAEQFGVTKSQASVICAGVRLPHLDRVELTAAQKARAGGASKPILLDDLTRAEIEAAKRTPAPPYKAQAGWPP